MVNGWNRGYCFAVVFFLHLVFKSCWSMSPEGLVLLEFRSMMEVDPHGIFENWNPADSDPCNWPGVHCSDGKVDILNLKDLSLKGILAPELGKLVNLRSIVLSNNNIFGVIPKEIGGLKILECLDLRENDLSGMLPVEILSLPSLKYILLCGNKIQGGLLSQTKMLHEASDLQKVESAVSMVKNFGCPGRKDWNWFALEKFPSHVSGEKHVLATFSVQEDDFVNPFRRILFESNRNLPAVTVTTTSVGETVLVSSHESGSFPAKPKAATTDISKPPRPAPRSNISEHESSKSSKLSDKDSRSRKGLGKRAYFFVIPFAALLVFAIVAFILCRQKAATIGPWRPGLSGQLKKAFITGAPKLNRSELEAACEEFSNIIYNYSDFTVFKGTLSSGVEIVVVNTTISSIQNWSNRAEMLYRKKIDTLSRINHKNFVNLLGYCEENDPFTRMMVFEYAPNGTIFEHLHVKEFEHLNWDARMRIIMGVAYCLQYMHHDINPPIVHPDMHSNCILITDDYAAKLADITFWKVLSDKKKHSGGGDSNPSETRAVDPQCNVYGFGVLLLEIISGRNPHSEEQRTFIDQAMECLTDNSNIRTLVDPTLASVKDNELDAVCEVIRHCIRPDPKTRPTMREVACKLRAVIRLTPEAAAPRLSPLWWAELEILSVQAS